MNPNASSFSMGAPAAAAAAAAPGGGGTGGRGSKKDKDKQKRKRPPAHGDGQATASAKPSGKKRGGGGGGSGRGGGGRGGGGRGTGNADGKSPRRGNGRGESRGNKSSEATGGMTKSNFEVLKRVPERFRSAQKNDLFISRNSEFVVQLAKAEKLFQAGNAQIVIHGLGAAINRSICLAFRLQQKLPFVTTISTNTSTVPLVDDLIPTKEILLKAQQENTQVRNNSAIHITLSKVKPAGLMQPPNQGAASKLF